MKNYPLDVEVIDYDEVAIFSRGHHDLEEFMKKASTYVTDYPHIVFGKACHEWWRVVPDGDGGGFVIAAKPNSRGAYPATVINEA